MERMLVALDGSDNAEQVLPYVEQLGHKMNLAVTLLRVCLPGETADKKYLGGLAEKLTCQGLEARAHTLSAANHTEVPQTIVEYASENDIFLIALVTHGHSGITAEVCGATARGILTHSTIPVMMVRTKATPPRKLEPLPEGILVTLDGSRLAEQALPFAEKLARRMRGELIIFRVGEPEYKVMPADRPSEARSPAESDIETRLRATDYLSQKADELRSRRRAKVRAEMQIGMPADTIVRRASQADVCLIAMSTHGRSGLGRIIYGSIAEEVLHHSPVPVVLVRAQ